jgi:6-phosphogluconolactonase
MNIQTFNTEREWIEAGVNSVQEYLDICIREKQISSLAVSGGSTPFPIYEALSQKSIQWDKVNLVEVDERYVPENSDESNWANIQKSFNNTPFHHIIRFKYTKSIEKSLHSVNLQLPEQLGVVILGMGLDGHFASLFPGAEYWNKIHTTKSLITQAPESYITRDRLSLSPEYILQSHYIIVILKGKDKYDYLINSLNQNYTPTQFPLQYIAGHANLFIYCYLD